MEISEWLAGGKTVTNEKEIGTMELDVKRVQGLERRYWKPDNMDAIIRGDIDKKIEDKLYTKLMNRASRKQMNYQPQVGTGNYQEATTVNICVSKDAQESYMS